MTVAPGAAADLALAVRHLGGQVTRQLPLVNGLAVRLPAGNLPLLAGRPGVNSLAPDARLHPMGATYSPTGDTGSLYNTTLMTGARKAWSAGYTGKGVDVAVIDTGVTPIAGLSDSDKLVQGPDLSWDSQAPNLAHLDGYGHGTFMAGIVGGADVTLPAEEYAADSADFLGMAPDSRIVALKVADGQGSADVSQIIAAIDWTVQHAHDDGFNIRVINLSYGTDSLQPYALDPLAYAAEQAWFHGIAVVVAAGNDGATSLGLADPARDPFLIAVGAVDTHGSNNPQNHTVAGFSDYGNVARNPDLIAPGVHIESLRVPGSYIDVNYGATGQVGSRYFRGSGTSEAAAVVSGAAALLFQEHPGMTPGQLKSLLTSTADNGLAALGLALSPSSGHGELDLNRAIAAPVPASPGLLGGLGALVRSTGAGSLELSRGSAHVALDGIPLTGERDIFGRPVGAALAAAESCASSWMGGGWNGSTWTGSTWTGSTWTGSTWTGSTWTGSTWTGSTWTGSTWTGSTWTGSTWTSRQWSGSTWTGSTWTGSTWTGSTWTGSTWTGRTWSSAAWG